VSQNKVANRIRVSGCDDSTEIWFEMTQAEEKFMARLAVAINDASRGNCQPVIYLNGEFLETPDPEENEE
jgi:hypothetical protein